MADDLLRTRRAREVRGDSYLSLCGPSAPDAVNPILSTDYIARLR